MPVHLLHREVRAEGAADADPRATLRLVQHAGDQSRAADAELHIAPAGGRTGDGDGNLAVPRDLHHDELTGAKSETFPLGRIQDAHLKQLFHVGERDDAGNFRLEHPIHLHEPASAMEIHRLQQVRLFADVVVKQFHFHRRSSICSSRITSVGLIPARHTRPQRLQPTHLGSS